MNSLSWVLYLADLADGLKGMAFATMFITGFGLLFYTIFSSLSEQFDGKIFKKCFIVLGVSGTIFTIIPYKDTIYLMAGSEAAEAVASTEDGKQIIADVKQIIRKQLEIMK